MPTIANITVKKNDGTTDVTYTAVTPSSGDASPAIWKSQTVGNAPAHQPEVRVTTRDAAKGARRIFRATAFFPSIYTDSTTGLTSVFEGARMTYELSFAKSQAQTDINEAASQFANLLASALLKDAAKTGYAPA